MGIKSGAIYILTDVSENRDDIKNSHFRWNPLAENSSRPLCWLVSHRQTQRCQTRQHDQHWAADDANAPWKEFKWWRISKSCIVQVSSSSWFKNTKITPKSSKQNYRRQKTLPKTWAQMLQVNMRVFFRETKKFPKSLVCSPQRIAETRADVNRFRPERFGRLPRLDNLDSQ